MAYTLKASGIATALTMCVAVDDDNTTIKEFVSSLVNGDMTFDTGVAAGVGTSTWKGVSQGYFPTFNNGTFDYLGIRFGTNKPSALWNAANPSTMFFVWSSADAAGGAKPIIGTGGGNFAVDRGVGTLRISNGAFVGSTTLPSDGTTKFSAGFNFTPFTGGEFYYGLESGSLASDGTFTDTLGFTGSGTFDGIGGAPGQGHAQGHYHLVAKFNRVLTLTEMQSLHNDWRGTLFDSAAAPAASAGESYLIITS